MSERISGDFDRALGPNEKQALGLAVDWVQDHAALATDGQLDISLVEFLIEYAFLPIRYQHRYDEGFVQRFLLAVESVIAKLAGQDQSPLESTAQELALHGLLATAEELAELNNVEVDFDLFRGLQFEDLDHELLFDPALDGVEEDTANQLRFANLRFEDWFESFRP